MILQVESLVSGYTGKDNVLRGVSLDIDDSELVVLMGHNGAGKTTLLNAIFGLLKIRSGQVIFQGRQVNPAKSRAIAGISYCLQGQGILPSMTVMENLDLAAIALHVDKKRYQQELETSFELFPILKDRTRQIAGTLSGGQQRMLSISMALIQQPKLLLLDEPSLGLSPALIEEIYAVIKQLSSAYGMGILLVEQNVKNVLSLAQRIYILKMGEIVFAGSTDILADQDQLWQKL
jgi:branched-chain amino acid transport system ATP-binding protein